MTNKSEGKPSRNLNSDHAKTTRDLYHEALKKGHPPYGFPPISGIDNAVTVVSKQMNKAVETIRSRVKPGGSCERAGFEINIKLYKPMPIKVKEATDDGPWKDALSKRRDADSIKNANARALEAERRAIAAEGLREAVFGLAETPLEPPSWGAGKPDAAGKFEEAIVLFASDIHMGETIK